MKLTPQIYVLGSNTAEEDGLWVDAAFYTSYMLEEIEEEFGEGESWYIVDSVDFEPYSLAEEQPLEEVSALGLAIEKHGTAAAAFASLFGIDYLNELEGYYCGSYESKEKFIKSELDEQGVFNVIDSYYLDYEKLEDDWFINSYDYVEHQGDYYIFRR